MKFRGNEWVDRVHYHAGITVYELIVGLGNLYGTVADRRDILVLWMIGRPVQGAWTEEGCEEDDPRELVEQALEIDRMMKERYQTPATPRKKGRK